MDDMATYEFYLEKNGDFFESLASIPGKQEENPHVRSVSVHTIYIIYIYVCVCVLYMCM